MTELHLRKKDFKIEWYSGTGGGGQHRNKHQNCCRITHLESGLVENGTSFKERPLNQKEAFTKLAKRVIAFYSVDENDRKNINTETIRTYHGVRNEVIDKKSGLRQTYKKVVIDGDIADMIEHRKTAMEQDLI